MTEFEETGSFPSDIKDLLRRRDEFFSSDAQLALQRAEGLTQEARRYYITDLDLLAGILQTMPVYTDTGEMLDREKITTAAQFIEGRGSAPANAQRIFTTLTQQIIASSIREAEHIGLEKIDTRCLLLGIIARGKQFPSYDILESVLIAPVDNLTTRLRDMKIEYL